MFFIYMTYTLLALHVEECTVSGLLLGFTQVRFQDLSQGLLRYGFWTYPRVYLDLGSGLLQGLLRYSFRTSPRVYPGTDSGLLLGFTQVSFRTSPRVYSGTVSGLLLGFTQVRFQDFSQDLLRFRFRTSSRVYSGLGSGLLRFSQIQVQDFSQVFSGLCSRLLLGFTQVGVQDFLGLLRYGFRNYWVY